MPIFVAQNPPRVENTEARPPLKRWAYFLIVVSADSDMIPAMELAIEERHPVFAYFPPFQRSSAIASMFTSVIRMERYESRFRNSLLPDTVRLRDGYELTIPEKWKAYQSL